MSQHRYVLEHICSYSAHLQSPPEVIGALAEGVRLNIYVTGGDVTGPRLQGHLRAVGADWLTIRPDGIAVLDVRTTIETRDGALIYVAYNGLGDLGPDGHENFLRGELPHRMKLRTSPQLRSAHEDYVWINRHHYLGIGEVDFEQNLVHYDVHAVR